MPSNPHPPDEFPVSGGASRPERTPFVSEVEGDRLRLGPVTILLIAVCVLVALYSSIGSDQQRLLPLFIGLSPAGSAPEALAEVRAGEVWRLFTPMFIHFGLVHLIFNMLWLKDLGTAIERRGGSGFFLAMVLVLALCSDLGQYFVSGPFFGGMSGVVYGLFGYVWLRSALDPGSGYLMPRQTVVIMLAWFVFCLLGILNVANTAHGVGLVVGAAWGFLAAKLAVARRGGAAIVHPLI